MDSILYIMLGEDLCVCVSESDMYVCWVDVISLVTDERD